MKGNGFTLKMARSRQYLAQTIMAADYADDIALLVNTPNQAKSLLHSLWMQTRQITCVSTKRETYPH